MNPEPFTLTPQLHLQAHVLLQQSPPIVSFGTFVNIFMTQPAAELQFKEVRIESVGSVACRLPCGLCCVFVKIFIFLR